MDLTNELSAEFPELSISQQEAPTYVKCHWNENQRSIILVHKQGKTTNIDITPKKREQTTLISEFDLTGSPLKLDMAYDMLEETFLMDLSQCWLKEEISHEPLTLEETRNVLNFYNTKIHLLSKEERIPLWVVCDGQDQQRTVLMAALTYKGNFNRGIVYHSESTTAADLSVDKMKENHWRVFGCSKDQKLTCTINGTYRISGKRVNAAMLNNLDVVFNKHYTGMTQLECEWTKQTLQVPIHEANIKLVQETIVGHNLSGSTILWKSVCALQGISSALISLGSTMLPSKLADISIRPFSSNWTLPTQEELEVRLRNLLDAVEEYGSLARGPKGGCICIADDTTSLQQVYKILNTKGSSNDFTYKLWDILKDCDTVDDVITLLVHALKDVYKRNLRPFIDPGNSTILGTLVKKLARGSSQHAINSLSTLYSNPTRALNIIGQLGIAKICWEYTNIFALIDNTLAFNDRLRLQNNVALILFVICKTSEVNEEIYNQTILDMTLGAIDQSINPFDTKLNLMDSTIMQEPESSLPDRLADISLDSLASFKKHKIHVNTEKKVPEKDQPLFSDEMDIELTSKEWKFKLTRLAQLQTCLEHVYRAQQSLNADFNTLKPITIQLLDHYTADNSPIKTVGQLRNEPVQAFTVPIQFKTVKEHLQFKHATVYKVTFTSQDFKEIKNGAKITPCQTIASTFVCSLQPLFPPTIYSPNELPEDLESLYYHCTKFLYLSNAV